MGLDWIGLDWMSGELVMRSARGRVGEGGKRLGDINGLSLMEVLEVLPAVEVVEWRRGSREWRR